MNALLAQLDRVTGYEPVGQGFESLAAHHKNHVEFSAWFLFFIMYFIKITARSQISESGLFYIIFSLRCQKISLEIPLACKFPLW